MNSTTIVTGEGANAISVTYLDEPMEYGLIGMASSPLFKENIAIVIDNNSESNDYSFACLGCAKNGTAPRIMITKDFYSDLRNGTSDGQMTLFHELGHYVNGDIGNDEKNNDEERCRLVAENRVSEKELKADSFAVGYLGKRSVIAGLELLKCRILKECTDCDEESVRLSTKEIDIRILHILETNEE